MQNRLEEIVENSGRIEQGLVPASRAELAVVMLALAAVVMLAAASPSTQAGVLSDVSCRRKVYHCAMDTCTYIYTYIQVYCIYLYCIVNNILQ